MKAKTTPKAAARQPKPKALNLQHIQDAAADAMSTVAALAALVAQLSAQLEARDDNYKRPDA
jgi:hypothetical protein